MRHGRVVAAVEEERFTRNKFDRSFPSQSIDFCLKFAGITIDDIGHVGFFWQPWKGLGRRFAYAVRGLSASWGKVSKNLGVLQDLFLAEKVFRKQTGYKGKFYFLDHHLTHLASSYFSSGLNKSALISVDGTGEKTTCWMGMVEESSFKNFKKISWPHSLGHIYATTTQYLGFNMFADEYKVMGLSAYGTDRYLDIFREIIQLKPDGSFEIDLRYVDYQYFKKRWYSDRWLKTFGPHRLPGQEITIRHKDIAASLQKRLEEVLISLTAYVMGRAGKIPLCVSGGVMLNSKAVGRISESGLCEKVVTNPVLGDAGCALGAAYYIDRVLLGNAGSDLITSAFLGPDCRQKEVESILKQHGINYELISNPAKTAAVLLSRGYIIGWFQERAEFGQRSLGARSILADPRRRENVNLINKKIKFREPFRPFAPAILEDFQNVFFEFAGQVPFMTEIHQVKTEKRAQVPAIVHIDGSARMQTVSKIHNFLFWNLIDEFRKITNIPLVLNTSFNSADEPIVNSPQEALATFFKTDLDALVIGNCLVKKDFVRYSL